MYKTNHDKNQTKNHWLRLGSTDRHESRKKQEWVYYYFIYSVDHDHGSKL